MFECDFVFGAEKCRNQAIMNVMHNGEVYCACCYEHALHTGGEYPRCDYEDPSSLERCSDAAIWAVEEVWPIGNVRSMGPGHFCMKHLGMVLRPGYKHTVCPVKEIFDPKPEEPKASQPKCCYIDPGVLGECQIPAKYEIRDGDGPDDYTHACEFHVGFLLQDGKVSHVHQIPAADPLTAANVSETFRKMGCVGECCEARNDGDGPHELTIKVEFEPLQGWECPRCHAINSPYANRCDCVPNEAGVKYDYRTLDGKPITVGKR